ncbi:MAG: hypothetical protein ABI972_26820, partial [Acidobacteriota bacterium]
AFARFTILLPDRLDLPRVAFSVFGVDAEQVKQGQGAAFGMVAGAGERFDGERTEKFKVQRAKQTERIESLRQFAGSVIEFRAPRILVESRERRIGFGDNQPQAVRADYLRIAEMADNLADAPAIGRRRKVDLCVGRTGSNGGNHLRTAAEAFQKLSDIVHGKKTRLLVVIGTAHVVAATLADELAFQFHQTRAAARTVEHGFRLFRVGRRLLGRTWQRM